MPLPSIQITGNVVDDPELRFTASGKAVANFRVAANKSKKDEATGKWETAESCFLTVNAWELQAEAIAEQVTRGAKVIVTGQLKQREYDDRDGNKRQVYEVQAYEVALVVKGQTATREKPAQGGRPSTPATDPWATPTGSDTAPPF
jgi:single-strand DNA-binding protein